MKTAVARDSIVVSRTRPTTMAITPVMITVII